MNTTIRLMRSRNDRMIAGVAGGIAHYLGVDPVIVRLAFVLLAFSGASLLIYPLLWLVMPQEPASGPSAPAGDPAASQVFVAEGTPTQRLRSDPMTGQPLEPEQEVPINNVGGTQPDPALAASHKQPLGYILLGFGLFITLQMIFPGLSSYIFPIALIGFGIYLLRRQK